MKKLLTIMFAALAVIACSTDDQYDINYFTQKYKQTEKPVEEDTTKVPEPDTLYVSITYNGTTVALSGDVDKVIIDQKGADVTLTSDTEKYLQLTLSGTSTDGSLLVYSLKPWGLVLNGIQLTNADGPAINNQCSKWLYVTLADGTENTLTDGESYAEQTFDQKGTLFSEGQIHFAGTGTLNVNGNAKNGIASDDYIVIDDGTLTINVESDGGRGIKVNDGLTINGGSTTITTLGDCRIENTDGVRDTTSAAGIKSDSLFVMTNGSHTVRRQVTWIKPDGTIFSTTVYQWKILATRLRELAFLNRGIHH